MNLKVAFPLHWSTPIYNNELLKKYLPLTSDEKGIHIVVLGEDGVGKNATTAHFVCGRFFERNKKDLEQERQVSTDEGRKLANKYQAVFFETSAKEYKDTEKIFYEAVWMVARQYFYESQPKQPKSQQRCVIS